MTEGRRRRTILASAFCGCVFAAVAQAEPARLLEPAPGALLPPGAIVRISWTPGDSTRRNFDEMELVLSLDGGESFPLRVTRQVSPAADSVLWRVPRLPSEHARLALRAGRGEKNETETIRTVSAEFTILPAADDPLERVYRVRGEWRTVEAAGSAKDLPEQSLSGSPQAVRAAFSPDGAAESSGSTVSARDRGRRDVPLTPSRPAQRSESVPPTSEASSIPLRQ
ncbi:MAG TPA: hypothetical protein VGK86_10215 [Thermoanaerobaculia bacterium]|jgi:hypothetical protein